MNRIIMLALLALFATGIANGQQKSKSKTSEEVIIRKKGGSEEKTTIVIDGDRVTINGKPITEYDGDNIVIRGQELERAMAPLARMAPRMRILAPSREDLEDAMDDLRIELDGMRDFQVFADGRPGALLGVATEAGEKGLKVMEVTEGSAAAKAGLKAGDIITKFGGESVDRPEELRELVRARKPEDEVELSYIKAGEKKERKLKLKLGKAEMRTYSFSTPEGPRPPRPPRPPQAPRAPYQGGDIFIPSVPDAPMIWEHGDGYRYGFSGRPQLGVRIQDTDDSSGVKILEVNEGSPAATAGLKDSDVIVSIDGKRVKDTDQAREALQGAREKSSYPIVINRGNSPMTIEIKIPRKLKKADL